MAGVYADRPTNGAALDLEELRERKQQVRARARAARHAMTHEQRVRASELVCVNVLGMPELAGARSVMVYGAAPDEVDVAAIGQAIRDRGGRSFFPRVEGDELAVVEVTDDTELVEGFRGILEPTGPPVDPEVVDVVVVPGLAFDTSGRRLGQGKGFYDRLLPRMQASRIAVAFACQLVDEVPVDDDDELVDAVVTETGVVRR